MLKKTNLLDPSLLHVKFFSIIRKHEDPKVKSICYCKNIKELKSTRSIYTVKRYLKYSNLISSACLSKSLGLDFRFCLGPKSGELGSINIKHWH